MRVVKHPPVDEISTLRYDCAGPGVADLQTVRIRIDLGPILFLSGFDQLGQRWGSIWGVTCVHTTSMWC